MYNLRATKKKYILTHVLSEIFFIHFKLLSACVSCQNNAKTTPVKLQGRKHDKNPYIQENCNGNIISKLNAFDHELANEDSNLI
jgi:hypothetical protein